ncbi:MAG TPA: hypothetical protein VHB48_20380, partial [Chitinophagaceae bacterium]|nr:hypothetical protein [Chitinophagaceae bacterium]
MKFLKKLLYHPFFIKLMHWEYWSFNAVYGPVYIVWVLLCIKTRSFFFFSTSNPTIKNGGFLLESKMDIYNLMPQEYYPPTIFFKAGISNDDLLQKLNGFNPTFPIIGKPDIGGRGKGVKKLYSAEDVIAYANSSKVDFLLQAFVPYEREVGIFYYRLPNEEKGHISGIVSKEFLSVTGDGASTIYELLNKEKRFILQMPVLKATFGNGLNEVLPMGEKKVLVPYGNHARGAKFVDVSHWADERLTAVTDAVCRQIPGFYFGRLDVRYNDWEEVKKGRGFSLIEVNGAGSEPTHMYDPCHSLFFAWKEI